MTSSNGNIFRVTGHLCGEFTGPRWIPHTKASDAELWCYFDLRPNKRLGKQSRGWWFETLSPPLWRHRNGVAKTLCILLFRESLRSRCSYLPFYVFTGLTSEIVWCDCDITQVVLLSQRLRLSSPSGWQVFIVVNTLSFFPLAYLQTLNYSIIMASISNCTHLVHIAYL